MTASTAQRGPSSMAGKLCAAACILLLLVSGSARNLDQDYQDDVEFLLEDIIDSDQTFAMSGALPEASDALQPGVAEEDDFGEDDFEDGHDYSDDDSDDDSDTPTRSLLYSSQTLEVLKPQAFGHLIRSCKCPSDVRYGAKLDPVKMQSQRDISNKYMADGDAPSSFGLSNALFAWGQLVDHDMVGAVDNVKGEKHVINLNHGRGDTVKMTLHRLLAKRESGSQCPVPITTLSPQLDAGPVYSNVAKFMQLVLRQPGSCKLRATRTEGNRDHLPLTTKADRSGNVFFIAGDTRVNEHAVLTAMHTIFLREHNRLCDRVPRTVGYCERDYSKSTSQYTDWQKYWDRRQYKYQQQCTKTEKHRRLTASEKFDLVRKVIAAKFQHITLNEFLPALGISKKAVVAHKPKHHVATVSVEFAAAAWRVGHDMIPNRIGKLGTKDMFGGERFYLVPKSQDGSGRRPKPDNVMDTVLREVCKSKSNQIDGKLSDSIRNVLFGPLQGSKFGEDLATRTLFRGHDMCLPDYKAIAACYGGRPGKKVSARPWITMDAPFTLMLHDNDQPTKQVLGPTLRRIILDQFHRVMFAKNGGQLYKSDDVGPFLREVQTSTLAKVINANSGAKVQARAFHV